jgi:hypothetical protein
VEVHQRQFGRVSLALIGGVLGQPILGLSLDCQAPIDQGLDLQQEFAVRLLIELQRRPADVGPGILEAATLAGSNDIGPDLSQRA